MSAFASCLLDIMCFVYNMTFALRWFNGVNGEIMRLNRTYDVGQELFMTKPLLCVRPCFHSA
jgi:hypothetical protein